MKLRNYQLAAVDAIFDYFQNGGAGNPVVALPTGTGKSVVIAGFIRRALETYPGTRVMKLTHVKELISQNLDKLKTFWPNAPAGVYSAGLKRKEAHYPITFGGIGTVARKALDFGHIDLLLIDECHLVSPKENTQYQQTISALKSINPHLKVIGFTATHYRAGQGMLTEEGGLFTDVCFDMTAMHAFNWLLAEGYLCHLIPKPTSVELDVSEVHTRLGEYKQDELQAAVDKDDVTRAACEEMLAYGESRKHWLVFASGVQHAIHVADMLNSMGVATTYVHSEMSDQERDTNLADYLAGKYQAMVNNGILTTGFDFPALDLIAVLRPTQSTSLWVQMLGRGTRPFYLAGFDLDTTAGRLAAIAASSKINCLVLDFARNTVRLGPINDPVLPKKKGSKAGGMAPVRLCESCYTYIHASLTICPNCGNEFPRELKIADRAGTSALIATEEQVPDVIEEFKVDRVTYGPHYKEGRPPSIQATYLCGLRTFKTWVCLEHEGFAAKKARDWWRTHMKLDPDKPPIPSTTVDALASLNELRTPTYITVKIKEKNSEVLSYKF